MVQVLFRLGIETPQLINLINIISIFLKGGIIPIMGLMNLEIVAYYFAKSEWDNTIADRDYTTDMNKWRKGAERSYATGQKVTKTSIESESVWDLDATPPAGKIGTETFPKEKVEEKDKVTIPLPKGKRERKVSPAPKKVSDSKGAVAAVRRKEIRKKVESGENVEIIKKALAEEFGVSIQTIEEDIDKANEDKYDKTTDGMF